MTSAGKQRPERRARVLEREEDERRRHERQARHHQRARPELVGELPGDRRDEDDQHRHRQERRARLYRRVAEARSARTTRRRRTCRTSRAPISSITMFALVNDPVAEEVEVEHRQALVALQQEERDEEDRREREEAEHERIAPAAVVRLDQPVRQREEGDRRRSRGRAGRDAARRVSFDSSMKRRAAKMPRIPIGTLM